MTKRMNLRTKEIIARSSYEDGETGANDAASRVGRPVARWSRVRREPAPRRLGDRSIPRGMQLRDRVSDPPELEAAEDGVRAVARAELREEIRDVVLHGAVREVERLRYLAIRVAAGKQAQDFRLALGDGIRV